jgi:tetratricopeptide (TPR) repeat protein
MHYGTDPYYGRFNPRQVSASLDAAMHLLSRTQPFSSLADEVTGYFQEHFPDDYRAPLRHGHLMMYRGNYAAAVPAFEKAITLKPTPDAYTGLSRAHGSLKNKKQRDIALKSGLKLFPDDGTALNLKEQWRIQ